MWAGSKGNPKGELPFAEKKERQQRGEKERRQEGKNEEMNEAAAASPFLSRACVKRLPAISCQNQLGGQEEAPMYNGSEMNEI